MSKEEKGSWAVKVAEGRYHVKIKLKLVDPQTEPGGEFEIKVNDTDKKGKIMGKHETIIDVRFLKVTKDEIRISRIAGYISMLEVIIETLKPEEDKLPKAPTKSNRMLETFVNCNPSDDNLNCVFEP